MTTENSIRISRKDEIDRLLEEHSPTELDELFQKICPFYESGESFTSAYGAFHQYVRSRILTELQLALEEMEIRGESPLPSGRANGMVRYEITLNGKKAEIRNLDGDLIRDIALIEIKTGNVKPLQAAAYTHMQNIPTITVEARTGDIHIMDQETAGRLLRQLLVHKRTLDKLEKLGKRIPDHYSCQSCTTTCRHQKKKNRPSGNHDIVKSRVEILENLGSQITELSSCIRELVSRNGYTISRKGER